MVLNLATTTLMATTLLKIGLTGGIASGKSTVSKLFADLGVEIIDADEIAHRLVEPGQPALQEIITAFGQDLLDSKGQLNRPQLRTQVFNSPTQRRQLEAILHPRIRQEMMERIAQFDKKYGEKITTKFTTQPIYYIILVIPLLLETQQQDLVDRILVIDCPVEIQRQRLKNRSGFNDSEIDQILATQASRQARVAIAHDIIENNNNTELTELTQQVVKLHQKYLILNGVQNPFWQ